jgi:hypothetical protein|eukprot:COSAG06_NODE_227_length_19736_cov_15.570708_9_plen_67_part_00
MVCDLSGLVALIALIPRHGPVEFFAILKRFRELREGVRPDTNASCRGVLQNRCQREPYQQVGLKTR